MLDTFDAVRDAAPGPSPRPTIADASSESRRLSPGQSHSNPSLGLATEQWKKFEVGLKSVLARCRDRGYEPTFHPETGTFVEAPWEIERVSRSLTSDSASRPGTSSSVAAIRLRCCVLRPSA